MKLKNLQTPAGETKRNKKCSQQNSGITQTDGGHSGGAVHASLNKSTHFLKKPGQSLALEAIDSRVCT